jgi:hypothetical protein
MINIRKYKVEKATICVDKNCVTVYDDVARVVNTIVISVAVIAAIAYVAKALR